MYVESEWREFAENWRKTVVEDTTPIDVDNVMKGFATLYKTLGLNPPKDFILAANPVEMFKAQLWIEGELPEYHARIEAPKICTNITGMIEAGLAYGFMGPNFVDDFFDYPNDTPLQELIKFEELPIDSCEDDNCVFINSIEDSIEKELGIGEIWNVFVYGKGNWSEWLPRFEYLMKVFNVEQPLIRQIVNVTKNAHYFMLYENYVLLCQRPVIFNERQIVYDGLSFDKEN
jgi:hypothetical protein